MIWLEIDGSIGLLIMLAWTEAMRKPTQSQQTRNNSFTEWKKRTNVFRFNEVINEIRNLLMVK